MTDMGYSLEVEADIISGDGIIKMDVLFICPSCGKLLADNCFDDDQLILKDKDRVAFNDGKRWCKYCGIPFQILIKIVPAEILIRIDENQTEVKANEITDNTDGTDAAGMQQFPPDHSG